MSRSKLVLWLVGIVAVVVVGLLWWKNETQGNVIKVGFIGPLTGNSANFGETYRNVVAMAVDEINASDGINGKKLEVIYEDGKCDGTDAVNAMNKLVNVDGVQAVLGGFCTGESVAIIPIANASKVALLSSGSTGADLDRREPIFLP